MDLEQRHPDYVRFEKRWRMARCFWLGGIYVLSPDFAATFIGDWIRRDSADDGTDPEQRDKSEFSWITSWAHSFLWKHERETKAEFEMRHERIINPPLFQYIINTLSAGMLRTKPTRETAQGIWKAMHADFDGLHTDVDAWMRRALAMGLVYGRVHGITDRPAFDTPALSRGEQLQRQDRAFARLVSPLDVTDWYINDSGAFEWVVMREDDCPYRAPGSPEGRKRDRYRIRYPDHWELWVEKDERITSGERWRLVGEGPLNGIGFSTLYATRMDQPNAMAIETPLADFLDGNRYMLNKFSELDEVDRAQSFSQMAIPTVDGQVGVVGIGPRRYIGYPTEAGAPSFISPDASLAEGKYNRLADIMHMWRQLAGISRGKSEYSKEERSAAALTVESEDKRNQLAWWSKALNEFDAAVHADMALFEGVNDYPGVVYPTNYDVKATMTQITEAVQLVAGIPLLQNAHETQEAIVKPIIRKMLGDAGAEEEAIDAVLSGLSKAIDDAKQKAEREMVAKEEAARKPFNNSQDVTNGPA